MNEVMPPDQPDRPLAGMKGRVINNSHFVDNTTGIHYAIESVIGYDKYGGDQIYYAWLFPKGHPARAVLILQTGKVQID